MGILSRVKNLFTKRADEPIHAFVLLRNSPLSLDAETLERVITRAIGVGFTNKSEDDPNACFVVGTAPTFMVKLPDAMVMINSVPAPYVNNPEKFARQIPELRMRKAVAEHTAWVFVDWMGDRSPESLTAGYRTIGKIAAELVDDNCVAIYSTSTSQLIPPAEDVIKGLRWEEPLDLFNRMLQPPVVNITADHPLMQAAVDEARKTWPEFVTAFEQAVGENHSIKAPVSDGRNTEFIWIAVKGIDGEVITGELANDPVDLRLMKLGSVVRVALGDLNDWAYIVDGEMVGGFTVKILQQSHAGG